MRYYVLNRGLGTQISFASGSKSWRPSTWNHTHPALPEMRRLCRLLSTWPFTRSEESSVLALDLMLQLVLKKSNKTALTASEAWCIIIFSIVHSRDKREYIRMDTAHFGWSWPSLSLFKTLTMISVNVLAVINLLLIILLQAPPIQCIHLPENFLASREIVPNHPNASEHLVKRDLDDDEKARLVQLSNSYKGIYWLQAYPGASSEDGACSVHS